MVLLVPVPVSKPIIYETFEPFSMENKICIFFAKKLLFASVPDQKFSHRRHAAFILVWSRDKIRQPAWLTAIKLITFLKLQRSQH